MRLQIIQDVSLTIVQAARISRVLKQVAKLSDTLFTLRGAAFYDVFPFSFSIDLAKMASDNPPPNTRPHCFM